MTDDCYSGVMRAMELARAKRHTEALRQLEDILASESAHEAQAGFAFLMAGAVAERAGDRSRAIEYTARALALGEDIALCHFTLSGLYQRMGDAENAERHLQAFLAVARE